MVVNFRTRGISRDARKLARTPTLNSKKKKTLEYYMWVYISVLWVSLDYLRVSMTVENGIRSSWR